MILLQRWLSVPSALRLQGYDVSLHKLLRSGTNALSYSSFGAARRGCRRAIRVFRNASADAVSRPAGVLSGPALHQGGTEPRKLLEIY